MQINDETIWKKNRFQEEALPHMDSVYKCALRMAKNESDAKDLVQETYIRAYKFFSNFRTGTSCKAWLITILRNTFINTIRRERRSPQTIPLSEISDNGIELPGDDDLESNIFGNRFDDDVIAAMDSLPAKYRTAVLLADMEGFSYREIAERIGCPIM
jgi:RNA polymerase sigma-70 factor (ECF subfamily)